ncbi:MAG: TonB-dependent receptor plug domain-containing protein, partial [Mucilaginibacter sp.]
TPLKKEDIIAGPNKQGIYALNFNGDAYFITYNKYHRFNRSARSKLSDPENKDNTLVSFNHPRLLFDANGSVINPNGLVYDGVWVRGRLATLLPLDFEPLQNNTGVEIDSALVKNITSKVNAYNTNHLTEKTYLHFDKPYYAAGDTMYFKAYLTEGDNHALSHLSRILYVDLINTNHKISTSLKLVVSDGVAWGDIALPRTLTKGSYRVRAYTQWMRNEGDAAFFDKTITIGSSSVDALAAAQIKPALAKPDIEFFPEGGNLIAGVPGKIAFKAVGVNGLGLDVKGVVIDNDNKEIVSFTSARLGMGAFNLTPAEGKSYTAKVSYPNGVQDVIELPRANPDAINMAFTDLNRLYAVKINSSKQWYQQNKGKTYSLIIYSGGMPQSFTVKLDNQQVSLDVLKRDFRTGIATATLFTSGGEPLCERLLFVQNNDQLKLSISTDKATYATRAKTAVKLNVTGGSGDPASGHFSVAVIDETKVPADDNNETGILGNILLTANLKGYIEQPGYYFAKPDEKTTADLDLVMLTHGYRNYEWKKILAGTPAGPYQPEKGLALSGIVKFNGKPLKNGKVKLFSRSAGGIILDTLSDDRGRFIFDNLTFGDTTKFVLQARTSKDQKEVDIQPDSVLASPGITLKNMPDMQHENLSVYEQSSKAFLDEQDKNGINKNTHMLKEVVIKDKKINPLEHSDNLNGAGNADQVITADWLEKSGYTRLYDALRATAHSIIFTTGGHRLRSDRVMEGIDAKHPPNYMLIVIDGSPQLGDASSGGINTGPLDYLDASDIESVEILLGTHGAAIYGSLGAGGAVIVTTKRGHGVNNYYKESPGAITFKANGFYKARQFYMPKYEHTDTAAAKKDLRTTVYWNPEIPTDISGNAQFGFYNTDGKGSYKVVVEGIDAEGNLGRQVFRYKVE